MEVAHQIVGDPERVRRLLARCFGNNKAVVNPVPMAEKRRLVLAVLERGPATSSDILAAVAPALNAALLRLTFAELRRDGLVRATSLPRSTQKLWELTS